MATLVTLAEVKAHVRKTTDDEDGIIAAYLAAAIAWVENYTGHVLSQRVVTDNYAEWGDQLTLYHQPITVGVPAPTLTVEYINVDGSLVEYADRVIRDQRYPWTIVPPGGAEFPMLGENGTISVTYTAGYGAGAVPDPLNLAILLLSGNWFAHRAALQDEKMQEAPLGVKSLCAPYRGLVMA